MAIKLLKYYLFFGSIWFLAYPLSAQEPDEFNKDTVSVNEALAADSALLAPADSTATADSLSNKKEKKEKKIELKTTRKIRGILSRISGYIGTGYGHYNYRSNVEGRGVTTVGDTTYIFQSSAFSGNTIDTAYSNWVTGPRVSTGLSLSDTAIVITPDSAAILYKGTGYSIPIDFGLYYQWRNFRFGLGGMFEIHRIRTLKPNNFEKQLGVLNFSESRLSMFRYYLLAGYTYDKYRYFDFSGELMLGRLSYGGDFDNALLSRGIFFNVGLKVERNFSEIFSVYVKPAFEYKGYRTIAGNAGEVQQRQPAVFLNFGAAFSLPSLRKCPVPSCHTQINHAHSGIEVRSRRHKFWKWQNPKYGENYRQLILRKGKNKRIRDPY